jgi:DNA-binding transcriptional LysR family regulator
MRNLEPILIFITVAEIGSFTRAADSLSIQKGRASTAVRKLEEDVASLEALIVIKMENDA